MPATSYLQPATGSYKISLIIVHTMPSLTITIIQSDLHWEDKAANLAMFEKKINGIKEKTEIVLLPEMFSTGFSMNPKTLAETMDGETCLL